MMTPGIDFTVRLGDLLVLFGVVLGGIAFIQGVKMRLNSIEATLKTMSNVLVDVARQDERLSALQSFQAVQDKRIDDLAHGRGFILDPPAYGPVVRGGKNVD